jgi:large subunit ribosomal protein L25
MPAVFYGRKEKSTPISVSRVAFKKVFRVAGESSMITLQDGTESHDALIYYVDADPITGEPRHADFYILEKDREVEVPVPLHFEGEAPALKIGGILVKVLHEINVKALPKDLPHGITVDLSSLVDFDSLIHIKDLNIPKGVTPDASPDEVVASIARPKEEKEEAPIDLSSIEVEKKGKKEEEGTTEGAADAA